MIDKHIVWPPSAPPSHPNKPEAPSLYEHVHIKHPGYEDACNTLLTLPPLDVGGVHHDTVRIACAIIAGNKWEGFLSLDREGALAVPESEKILRAQAYFFQIGRSSNNSRYDVVPNFEHWPFPQGNLPFSWRGISSFKQPSRPASDNQCRVTQYEDGVEDAHLVPTAQRLWFNNNMASDLDSTRTDKLRDPDNIIRLRSDVHTVFDAKRFAIIPIDGRLVIYCLNARLGSQIERLYHGVELHRIHDSGFLSQFLFARFAYTVFERLRAFLEANVPRKLRLCLNNETKVEMCDPERCWRFAQVTAYQGKSRSVSPKKRPAPDNAELADSDKDWSESKWRGRKRQRSNASLSFPSSVQSSGTWDSVDLSVTTPGTPPLSLSKSQVTLDADSVCTHSECADVST